MTSSYYRALCLPVTLMSAWKAVKLKNSVGGIDGFSVETFEEELKVNLEELRRDLIEKTWNPEPYLRIEIEKKNSSEIRKLGLLSVRDKIVQQAIKMLIEPKIDKLFLNNSYGYRPGKGPVRAIHRVINSFNRLKKGYVAKLDIDDYFDTIKHEQLFLRLKNLLQDEEIIRLIELCIKTGAVTKQLKWSEINKGVPQGAVLSPLLANFYLHPFDQFVVEKTTHYIRYADDFLLLVGNKEELEVLVNEIQSVLEKDFYLKLNQPFIADLENGVEFLGIIVKRPELTLSEKKKKDLHERIDSIQLKECRLTAESIETLQGIKNYYVKLLPSLLIKELDMWLILRIHEWIKKNKNQIPNKTTLSNGLKEIDFFADETNLSKPVLVKEFVNSYLQSLRKKKKNLSIVDNEKLIKQKKREYRKREMEGSDLVVSTPGSFIGKSNQGITVKLQGKTIRKKNTNALKHISITGRGISLSSDAIQYCVEHKIPIDFFYSQGKHYASLLSPISMDGMLWLQQSLFAHEKKIALACRILLGKLKNQENLVKYFHKYHKDTIGILAEKYPETILRMDECVNRIKTYSDNAVNYASFLMSQESIAATAYWDYIRLLVRDDGIDFLKREHRGATDLMNSMLNYGYAILYARIWDALLIHKLSPFISVLHAPQPGKPTFVYDVVELFRTQAVDRVVISLIQKGEPLKMQNNLLNEPTKRLLIQNIFERLNRYEKYRSEEMQFINIMQRQVCEIAEFISGESKIFKPYIAKW